MQVDRKLYDANLRMLEVELELAGFPDDVTWDLRREMPWSWREFFTVTLETFAYGCALKGMLFFQQMPVNDMYRFAAFELEVIGDTEVPKSRFERTEGVAVGLREAVNLMRGRPVYLDYTHDPHRKGYWVRLMESPDGPHIPLRSGWEFSVDAALERGLFRRRLGTEGCYDLARKLEKGDRVRLEINGKKVFVEVDLVHDRLLLTNVAGKPAKLNWWELFLARG